MSFLWFKTKKEKINEAKSKADKEMNKAIKILKEADREKRRVAHEEGLQQMNQNKKK